MVTSYNQLSDLKRAVDSLLGQTYENIEIIIADDGSTDGSHKYILDLAAKYPQKIVPIIQQKNIGIPANKNAGFMAAKGEYTSYLDGDDYYYPEKIEREIEILLSNPDCGVVYSNYEVRTHDDQFMYLWNESGNSPRKEDELVQMLLNDFPRDMAYRCEIIKSSILKETSYYDTNIPAYHDWESKIRVSHISKSIYCNYVGSVYLMNPKSISHTSKVNQHIKEIRSILEKNSHLLDFDQILKKKVLKKAKRSLSRMDVLERKPLIRIGKGFVHLLKHPSDSINLGFISNWIFGKKITQRIVKIKS